MSGGWTGSEPQGWGWQVAQRVPKPFWHYPGCSSGRLQGRSAGRLTPSLSQTHLNNHTHTYTHIYCFSLAICLCFVTNLSKNLQDTKVPPESLYACYMYSHMLSADRCTCTQVRMHLRQRGTLKGAETHVHTLGRRAEPLLCWWESGTAAGTPCTELVPSCLAASDSLQWGSTSQPPHCKQTEYVERILTAASKAPAYVWQQFIIILFYCVCWSNHRHRCMGHTGKW